MSLPIIDRRSFIFGSMAAGVGIASAQAIEFPANLDIIDCHTHFYDPTRPEGIPWPGKGTTLYRKVLPEHFRALKQYQRVTGTVIVEASPWIEDNAWLLELGKDDPFIVGVVGNLDILSFDYPTHVKRFAAEPLFRGIRISSNTLSRLIDKSELTPFRMLLDHDLALDVNGGPETPAIIAKLADRLPSLRIVLNHIGNVAITDEPPPRDWQAGIAQAAKHPNVFCKVSALVEGAARNGKEAPPGLDFYRPYIDTVWNSFSADRLIYGSNWPVSEQAADYATLQRLVLDYALERGESAVSKFCSLNAKLAYKWVERPGRR